MLLWCWHRTSIKAKRPLPQMHADKTVQTGLLTCVATLSCHHIQSYSTSVTSPPSPPLFSCMCVCDTFHLLFTSPPPPLLSYHLSLLSLPHILIPLLIRPPFFLPPHSSIFPRCHPLASSFLSFFPPFFAFIQSFFVLKEFWSGWIDWRHKGGRCWHLFWHFCAYNTHACRNPHKYTSGYIHR